MSSLTNSFIADSYVALLHSDSKPLTVSQTRMYDGEGNQSSISLTKNDNGATIHGKLFANDINVSGEVTTNNLTAASATINSLNGSNAAINSLTVSSGLTANKVVYPFASTTTTLLQLLLDKFFPIGCVYFTTGSSSPGGTLGGTWERISQGKFIVGVGRGTDENNRTKNFSAGDNDGEYRHTLTVSEMPNHAHQVLGQRERFGRTNSSGKDSTGFDPNKIKGATDSVGGDRSHENTPPGFGLYVWKRTA